MKQSTKQRLADIIAITLTIVMAACLCAIAIASTYYLVTDLIRSTP